MTTKPIDLLSAVRELVRKEVNASLRARIFGDEQRKPAHAALRCADCGDSFDQMTGYLSRRRWAHRAKAQGR